MARTLFLTRNGLLEPLGQSQIFPYLKGLSRDYKITVISFEKYSDRHNLSAFEQMRVQCLEFDIKWIPLRFIARPRPWAALFSVLQLFIVALSQWRFKSKPKLVHARSYVPGLVALILFRLNRVPFIFDMRALWPEELITSGVVSRDSFIHRCLIILEKVLISSSSGIVLLTNASLHYLRNIYPFEMRNTCISIIPTCVDLHKFSFAEYSSKRPLVVGCIGTLLSGWFSREWLSCFFDAVSIADPSIHFELISREDPKAIFSTLRCNTDWLGRLQIRSSSPEEMPGHIARHSASVMFYSGGSISELGRCPTRMAEVLACGRPVVINSGVGDVEDIVISNNVGVLATGTSPQQMLECVSKLFLLLKDPNLSCRCRSTAEKFFSLSRANSSYINLYHDILNDI